VAGPAAGGYITVFPGDKPRPTASNVNFSPGETVPNLVIVPVGANGTVNLYNGSAGAVALIADVSGYYTANGGHAFVPLDPFRVLDTRTGLGNGGTAPYKVPANTDQLIYLDGGPQDQEFSRGVAMVMNVTVVDPTAGGYITAYSYGTKLPTVSNLNFSPGETVPNLVMLGGNGAIAPVLHNGSAGTVNLVADAFGYFS